jgi:hypothetical protein
VQHLLYRTHDAHVSLTGGLFAAFTFLAPFSITAVSTDGKALPKMYHTEDLKKTDDIANGWVPSAIESINGQDAVQYLTNLASVNAFGNVEPHADWNQLFTTPTLDILGDVSVFGGYVDFFPETFLNTTLENGTTDYSFWLALYTEPYPSGPLTTPGDFYNFFVLGELPASYNETNTFNAAYMPPPVDPNAQPSEPTSPSSWRVASSGAYPDPDVSQPGLAVLDSGILSGYFLEDERAAVLSIPSFSQTGQAVGDFSQTVADFLDEAKKRNMSKAVIDLQQNTGGTVELVFSTFKRFFPDVDPEQFPFAGSRRRSQPLGNILGESYTAYIDSMVAEDAEYNGTVANEWAITPRLNAATKKNFTSWTEYYGPYQIHGDQFSLTVRHRPYSSWFRANKLTRNNTTSLALFSTMPYSTGGLRLDTQLDFRQ